MIELKDENYASPLKKGNILLMFYTDWCPLCPPIIEILTRLEREQTGTKFTFAKINYDTERDAVSAYKIMGVPMVLAMRSGKVLHGWGGLTDEGAYKEIIQEFFAGKLFYSFC